MDAVDEMFCERLAPRCGQQLQTANEHQLRYSISVDEKGNVP